MLGPPRRRESQRHGGGALPPAGQEPGAEGARKRPSMHRGVPRRTVQGGYQGPREAARVIEPRPRASFILPRVSVHAVCHTTHGGQPTPVPRGRRGGRCLPQPAATPQSTRCMLPTTSQTSPPGAPRHANPHVRARDTLCANACGKAEDATGAAISSRDADGAACMLFGAMRGYDAHAHPCATTMKQCWAAPSQGHGRPTQRRPVRHTTRHETTLRTCDICMRTGVTCGYRT